jgi:hypothetical protein
MDPKFAEMMERVKAHSKDPSRFESPAKTPDTVTPEEVAGSRRERGILALMRMPGVNRRKAEAMWAEGEARNRSNPENFERN